jgi:hypothetical protein
VSRYTLRFSKPVQATGFDDPKLRAAQHRAIKTRREAIKRRLRGGKETAVSQTKLNKELELLDQLETQLTGVNKRDSSLPLNHEGQQHVPAVSEIVEGSILRRFAIEKNNVPVALAKLAAINPEKYQALVREEARRNPAVRRAVNRVGSDISASRPTAVELLVLENYYVSFLLPRPLRGIAWDRATDMLRAATGVEISPDCANIFEVVQKTALTSHDNKRRLAS